jgi:phospholipid/cholesterol/gamma-HCH transport system permease protein
VTSEAELVGPFEETPVEPKKRPRARDRASQKVAEVVTDVGGMFVLFAKACRSIVRTPIEFESTVYQVQQMGVRSTAIACVTAIFTGMVMGVQFAFGLERFGGRDYVGRVVGVSMTRELAPALTALVVGSRIGAGMAAEIGSMAVTEQLDAIRALGADPVKKLVMPRMLACLILIPVLGAFADVLGFMGAMMVSAVQFGTPMAFFFRSALDSVLLDDLLSGLGKMPFFGVLIAIIGCYHGLTTRGGTEGVGRSTTRTVVVTSVSILLADFFLTKLFIAIAPET